MIRYIKQPDQWTCGPVAVANTLKWAGGDVVWQRDGDRLIRKSGAYPGFGAEVWRFDKILRDESAGQVHGFWQDGAKIKSLDQWVEHEDRCAIIIYRHRKGAHAFLCIKKTKHYYTVINLHRKVGRPTCKRIHRKKMIKLLRRFPKSNSIVYVEKAPSNS